MSISLSPKVRPIVFAIAVAVVACLLGWGALAETSDKKFIAPHGYEMPFGPSPFAPSNATTVSGQLISQKDFISAVRCLKCHASTHEEWSESAHATPFANPSIRPTSII